MTDNSREHTSPSVTREEENVQEASGKNADRQELTKIESLVETKAVGRENCEKWIKVEQWLDLDNVKVEKVVEAAIFKTLEDHKQSEQILDGLFAREPIADDEVLNANIHDLLDGVASTLLVENFPTVRLDDERFQRRVRLLIMVYRAVTDYMTGTTLDDKKYSRVKEDLVKHVCCLLHRFKPRSEEPGDCTESMLGILVKHSTERSVMEALAGSVIFRTALREYYIRSGTRLFKWIELAVFLLLFVCYSQWAFIAILETDWAPHNPAIYALRFCCFAYALWLTIWEAMQMNQYRMIGSVCKGYFGDVWNRFDWILILTLWTMAPWSFFVFNQLASDGFYANLLIAGTFLLWIKFLLILRDVSEVLAGFVQMLVVVVSDIWQFGFFLAVFAAAYAHVM